VRQSKQHINTLEVRAAVQVLLYWGHRWQGKRAIVHTDNRKVVYEIANGTTRGGSMQVLRRCLLLATTHYVELETQWISTEDKAQEDALWRLDYLRITDLVPQLIHPTANLQQHGLLRLSNPDCPLLPPTTCGGASHHRLDVTMTRPEPASPYFVP